MSGVSIRLTVNGAEKKAEPREGLSLLLYLRTELGLTGVKQGCSAGGCGACTVLVDGFAVQSCMTPPAGVEGAEIETIEALVGTPRGRTVTQALIAEGAAQCGYCLPGIVAAAVSGSDGPVEDALSRNLCRCGTRHRILTALRKVADHG